MVYAVILLSACLAYLAQKKNNRVFVWAMIALMSAFVGLRAPSVGVDTEMYYAIFNRLAQGIVSPNMEREFLFIVSLLLRVAKVEYLFLVFALLTNALIVFRLWSLRDREPFLLMSLVYLLHYYCETANIMRQFLAIAIVFYATIFLEKKKPLWFVALVLAAFLFHRSALLGLLYLPLYYFLTLDNLSRRINLVLIGVFGAIAAALLFIVIFGEKYLSYFGTSFRIGLLYPAELMIVCLYLFLNERRIENFKYREEIIYLRFITLSYALGIVLCAAGYYQDTLYRLGLYFFMFEIVFIPRACTKGVNRGLFAALYILLVLFLAYNNYLADWSGLANYSTWFA